MTNIFQKRAVERDTEKFSNSIHSSNFSTPTSSEMDKEAEDAPKENIFQKHAKKNTEKKESMFGFLDTLKDVGEQVLAKGTAGIVGAYGNILESFGLQGKEGEVTPAQEARSGREFDTLERINKGERPSFSDLMDLSGDEIPSFNRLPTSKEVSKGIERLTDIGEGKTPAGRIAGHGAEFIGEGIPTGGQGKALASLGAAGVAGQSIREAGGPEWAATGTEIAGSILPIAISGKLLPGKSVKDTVEAGRKIGLSEAQIAPLIQSEKKAATLGKIARKGTKTKERFASIKEKLGDSYNTIKSSPDAKIKIRNSDQIALHKEFGDIRNQLSKTLAASPDREAALNFIEKSMETLRNNNNITPEYLVNFWQDINKSVKWNSIQGGKKALTQLKKPVSDILKKVSPKLSEDFELTNQLYSKYAQISKKLKPEFIDSIINKGELLALPGAGIALATGNPWVLAGLAGENVLRIFAREMLISPYLQNMGGKLVKNFNGSSLKGITTSVNQVKEYMTRKHPDVDWSFLTNPPQEED